jgi:anti-sigma factor RsiW
MSEHLSPVMLSALADGELSRIQLTDAQAHLAECSACTSHALAQSLLKAATKKAGLRYLPTVASEDRMAAVIRQPSTSNRHRASGGSGNRSSLPLVGVAAAILLAISIAGTALWTRHQSDTAIASANRAALETEMLDQHIATLAANSPPQVISSDRHTVKPWFQGKLPFSFNLPENLPADTKLEGADLTYVHGQPAAQLIYSIGKHRVSVFITQRTDMKFAFGPPSDLAGFHVAGFNTRDMDAIAVSDVDPGRLSGLVGQILQAQTGITSPSK